MKNYVLKLSIIATICLIVYGCKKDNAQGLEEVFSTTPYQLTYGRLPTPIIPIDNPLTKEGVALGRMLFYENKLSRNNTQSCASCHKQAFAFSDTNKFSIGINGLKGKRHAMAIFNMAWHTNEFFWDGRAHLLRDQAILPIQDPLEMDESVANVVAKLLIMPNYTAQFKRAFGSNAINSLLISKALEQFMNSIVSHSSKYDDFLDNKVALTADEERGRYLFFTEFNPGFPSISGADCNHCHGGANFENDQYMNNGLDLDIALKDSGRHAVTKAQKDIGAFKVTSLRNIALTPPYMHDGRFNTLLEVVNHYNLVKNSQSLDPSFKQQLPIGLNLSQADKLALVAFLNTFTDYKLLENSAFSNPF